MVILIYRNIDYEILEVVTFLETGKPIKQEDYIF